VLGTQVPSNFRSGYARYIYETYGVPGGKTLDPSFGYGGRLIGFIASNLNEYVGSDPSTKSFRGAKGIVEKLSAGKRIKLFNLPFEDTDLRNYKNYFDLVFTSPPYFCKERYSQEDSQSYKRYPEYASWCENFLKILLSKSFVSLRKGRYCVININDIKDGNKVFPLIEDTIALAKKVGFECEKRDKFFLGTRTFNFKVDANDENSEIVKQSKESWEEVLIFKKQ
jgi:hypothetical protein